MNIIVQDKVMTKLMAYANAVAPKEFSGFGFVTRKGADLEVYDYVVLNVGSWGYTEIDPKKMMELMSRPDYANMKLWYHRHPILGWSGRDMQTILTEPLGGVPKMVVWSASMVLTPKGWIGRVDNYLKNTFAVCPVIPSLAEVYDTVDKLAPNFRASYATQDWEEEPKKKGSVSAATLAELSSRLQSLADDLGMVQGDLEEMIISSDDNIVDIGEEEEWIDEDARPQRFLSPEMQAGYEHFKSANLLARR